MKSSAGSVLGLLALSLLSAHAQTATTLADAIRLTLEQHPQIGIQQQQVEVQRGILRSAAGQFDVVLLSDAGQARTYRPLTEYEQFVYGQYDNFAATAAATNQSRVVLGASKQFRSGIVLSPAVTASRLTDNLSNRKGINQGSIQFGVVLPLLRGRGRDAVDAPEMMAAREVDAALFEVDETISNLVAATAGSYWKVMAAEELLEALRSSEARANALLDNTRHLIEADRLPRSDVNQVLGIVAIRNAARLAAEQQVVEARQALALNTGLHQDEVAQLPDVTTGFPPEIALPLAFEGGGSEQAYVQLAIERRPELRALKKREEAYQLAQRAAQNRLRPQLDITLTPGVSGLAEGSGITQFAEAPASSGRGLDFTGGITYRFPVRRDAAAGELQSATATARQANLQYEDAARRTVAAVVPAVRGLKNSLDQLKQMHSAVDSYRKALDAETERLQSGAGTVINLITLDDQLTNALQQEIAAKLSYAQALVRLRLATSTIVRPGAQGGSVDPAVFLSVPSLGTSTPAQGIKPDGSKADGSRP